MSSNSANSNKIIPIDKYFEDIDADFIGLTKAVDEDYVYNATDVLVQSTWELPIVIQWPGSVVKFEFSTEPSDISFGVVFVAAPEEDQDVEDLEIETIEELGRVSCDTEPVSGSFEVPSEGVVFFMWDNNYDWTANKKLSYLIEVHQPSFTLIDELRTEKVGPLIKDVVEDLEVAYVRHADAQDCVEHNTANVNFLEEQIASLQAKLDAKYKEADDLNELIHKSADMLEYGYTVEAGLCIRMLNKHCLSVVLSYLPMNGGANKVNKYWANLMALNRRGLVSGCELVYREPKMSRSDIQAALFPLKQRKAELERQSKQSKVTASKLLSAVSSTNQSQSTGKQSGKSDGKKPKPGDSDYDSALESDDSADHKLKSRHASSGAAVASSKSQTNKNESQELKRTNSGTNKLNPALSVSFDNMLPAGGPTNFTKEMQQVLTPEVKRTNAKIGSSGMYKSDAPAVANSKSHNREVTPPQPPASAEKQPIKSNDKITKSKNPETPVTSTASTIPTDNSHRARLSQYVAANNDRDEDWSRNKNLEPPVVAEGKGKSHRRSAGVNPEATQQAQKSILVTGKSSRNRQVEDAADGPDGQQNNNSKHTRMLLQHVQKIRSDQQLNAMLEYIQAGFDKIEVLNTEKRRIKKLIRAWNSSFEKKNGRLPTSSERKGHLRELYEEYHQVTLALKIRSDKMTQVLTSVGLDKESYEKLRQKQNLV